MTIQSCIIQNILILSDKRGTLKGEISSWNYEMDILSQSFLNQLELGVSHAYINRLGDLVGRIGAQYSGGNTFY